MKRCQGNCGLEHMLLVKVHVDGEEKWYCTQCFLTHAALSFNVDGVPVLQELLYPKISSRIELRDSVRRFAEEMEFQLRRHDDRGGWEDGQCEPKWLLSRLKEEVIELSKAMSNPNGRVTNVAHESADIANFAMMIADVVRIDFEKRAAERFEGEKNIPPE